MAEEATTNPITLTYRAIRAALLAWEPWVSLTDTQSKPARFPNLSDKSFAGFRETLAPNDLPYVALIQGTFTLRPFGRNSLTVGADQAFPLALTDDRFRLVRANDLKWETFRALTAAGEQFAPHVRTWDISQGTDHPEGLQQWNRGALRFVTVLQINVQLDLPKVTFLT